MKIIVISGKPNESLILNLAQNSLNTSEIIIRVVEDGKTLCIKDYRDHYCSF